MITSHLKYALSNWCVLTFSRRRTILYRNQSIDLQSKSMDWFLYDIGLHRERVNLLAFGLAEM